jgi:hypothetical protein
MPRKTLFDIMEQLWLKGVSFNYYAGTSALDEDYIEFPRRKEGPRVLQGENGDFFYEMYSILKGKKVIDLYEYDEVLELIYSYEGISE